MLGLFDRPADAGCIAALRKPPAIAGLTDPLFTTRPDANTGQPIVQPLLEEDWNTSTSFLVDFGLIAIQAVTDKHDRLLDCHPLIREHFARRISEQLPETLPDAHSRLYEHLCDSAPECTQSNPYLDMMWHTLGGGGVINPTIEDLQPLYQALVHGCKAGLFDECANLHNERINRGESYYAWNKLGAFDTELTALSCFFVQPWKRVASDLSELSESRVLFATAHCLRALGRLHEALDPMRVCAAKDKTWLESMRTTVGLSNLSELIQRALGHAYRNAVAGFGNLSELELTLGEVDHAVQSAMKSVELAEQTCNPDWQSKMIARSTLGVALHQAGMRTEAGEEFRRAEMLQAENEPSHPLLYSLRGFWFCELLLSEIERAAWLEILGSVTMRPSSLRGSFFASGSLFPRWLRRRMEIGDSEPF